ncbi:hypothetical protein CPB83DRAFT_934317 [Crepidotus variabilis]|uniref:Nephrocystin 3-like N-terminal domain-containing protein n=1 Tax=Crepidotus variabilis TaxID=179855 RepID=A0A9P6EDT8_9AGAR|nr:hypothetical protein CPB83DRAFT_934317 [Crepidotus variabilis]
MFTGGTYNHNVTTNTSPQDQGIQDLSKIASRGAMHDSSARVPHPKCHPESRRRIVEAFIAWIKNPNPPEPEHVRWLNAPFGHGKSAVMQTIVDTLLSTGFAHLVAGAFFFGPGHVDAHDLLPTIAYQIAINIPGMRELINEAVMRDPTIPSKSMELQLCHLIVEPLLALADGLHHIHHPTILIDGLDECATTAAQRSVLDIVADALVKHKLPLRFIVASRPESHIQLKFQVQPLSQLSKFIELENDLQAKLDMGAFLVDSFDAIYEGHLEVMSEVPKPWPSAQEITELIIRANGQYVYLTTVVTFVDAEFFDPVSQLDVVLKGRPDYSEVSNIDFLYRQILQRVPKAHRTVLQHILASLVIARHNSAAFREERVELPKLVELLTVHVIADIWDHTKQQILLVSQALQGVTKLNRAWTSEEIPNQCPPDFIETFNPPYLQPRHHSFLEFLEDENRAGEFYCNRKLAEAEWISRSQSLLKDALRYKYVPRVAFIKLCI